MMKAAVILSTLLNFAFLGAVAGTYFLRPADASFVANYMLDMDQEERELHQNADLRKAYNEAVEQGAETPEQFLEILREHTADKHLLERIEEMLAEDASVGLQRLLAMAASSQRKALARERNEHDINIERMNMRLGEFGDFTTSLNERAEDLKTREKDYTVRLEREQERAKNEDLQRAITAINEAKKAKDAVTWVLNQPVADQHFIIANLEDPNKQTAILNALPEADQMAIKAYKVNLGPDDSNIEVGTGSSTTSE